jgi:hypothetical protein
LGLVLLATVAAGCALTGPWYTRYGLKSEADLSNPESIPTIARAAREGNPGAVDALEKFGKQGIPSLMKVAASENSWARGEAMIALARMKHVEAIPVISTCLAADDCPWDKALQALYTFGEPGVDALVGAAGSKTAWGAKGVGGSKNPVHCLAIRYLGRLKDARAAGVLVETLSSGHEDELVEAVPAIEAIASAHEEIIDARLLSALKTVGEEGPRRSLRWAAHELFNKLSAVREERDRKSPGPSTEPIAKPVAVSEPASPTTTLAAFGITDASNKLGASQVEMLSNYLATRAGATKRYAIVPDDRLRNALKADKAAVKCDTPECQVRVGRAAGAEKVVVSKIAKKGDQCSFSASIYDIQSESAERSGLEEAACEPEALRKAIGKVVEKLLAQ